MSCSTQTQQTQPQQTTLPAGTWTVDEHGTATREPPYIPWYVDANGHAQPLY